MDGLPVLGAGAVTANNFIIQRKHTLSCGVGSHFGTGQFGVSGDKLGSVELEEGVLGMMFFRLSCPLTYLNFHSSSSRLLS